MIAWQDTADAILHAAGADACPLWCSSHSVTESGVIVHQAVVRVGTATVEVESCGRGESPEDQGGVYLSPEVDWLTGQGAHDYAEAVRQAAPLVHPLGGEQP